MGLDALLSVDDGVRFTRSLGSMGLVLPCGSEHYFQDSQRAFVRILLLFRVNACIQRVHFSSLRRTFGMKGQSLLRSYYVPQERR